MDPALTFFSLGGAKSSWLSLFFFWCRTKALVLELLAAVCLVRGGHEIILSAFDNFKEVPFLKHYTQRYMDMYEVWTGIKVMTVDEIGLLSSRMRGVPVSYYM